MKTKLLFFAVVLLSFFSFSTHVNAQSYSANPYDEVGAKHNVALAAFLNEYSKDKLAASGMDEKGLYEYVCKKTQVQNCDFVQQVRVMEVVQATKRMSLSEANAYFRAKGLISATFSAYVTKIDNSIQQYMGNYNTLFNALVAIENEVLSTPRLKDLERTQLLIACTVARHSTKFWSDLSMHETSYAGIPAGTNLTTTQGGGIGREDVKGAIAGAIGGAVAGAPAGGVGAGPGAVAGGIVGGASASVAEAAVQLWDWLWS